MSIDIEKALSFLSACSAELEVTINEQIVEWKPDFPPSTIVMSAVGRKIGSSIEGSLISNLDEVFSVVESIFQEGTNETKDAIATGLLESLLGQASAGKIDFRRIANYLGSRSKHYCKEWDKFTGCSTPGLEK